MQSVWNFDMNLLRTMVLMLIIPLPLRAQEIVEEWGSLEFALRAAIGFFGLVACLFFLHGLITYLTRLGTERREEGIKTMTKGVGILIVVVIVVGILRWLEG